jgi:hypothetical protein
MFGACLLCIFAIREVRKKAQTEALLGRSTGQNPLEEVQIQFFLKSAAQAFCLLAIRWPAAHIRLVAGRPVVNLINGPCTPSGRYRQMTTGQGSRNPSIH